MAVRSNGEVAYLPMFDSPSPTHTVVTIDGPAPGGAVFTINVQQQPVRSLNDKDTHRSTPIYPSLLRTASVRGSFLRNFKHRAMTRRQIAEIQLEGLTNDPEESLPTYARRACDSMSADDQLTVEHVSKLLNTQPFVIERLLRALNISSKKNPATTMSKSHVQKLTRVLNGSMDVRALVFFMMLDGTRNDYVTRDGLSEFYERYLGGIPSFDKNRSQDVIRVLLKKFHLDTKSRIDFDEFYSIVSKDRTLLESLAQFTVHPTWFVSPALPPPPPNAIQRFFNRLCWQQSLSEHHRRKLTINYLHDNLARVIMLTLYFLINIGLILWVIYRITVTHKTIFEMFARVGGMLLNFNCTLIIVLMLKQTILLIRSNQVLRKILPVDDHIDFHKMVGRIIAALAIAHTIAHMLNFNRRTEYSWCTFMFTTYPGIGWVGGFAPLSGIILSVILAIIVICSMQWIRRGGHFQIFYWTHLLYIVFFALLIVHAPNFWKWVVGPLSIFALEKLYSIFTRYSSRSGRTYLHSATIEQSNVISLNIHRPKYFRFKPGDYITINLPRVALYEFHPFTISSAPEDSDYLRIHIQASGNWTRQVYRRFKEMSEKDQDDSHVKVLRADRNSDAAAVAEEKNASDNRLQEILSDAEDESNISAIARMNSKSGKKEPIFVNGPYSSCARYVFDCKHVVLIGGGIGITPYASILSSLMAQFRASRTICKHCHGVNYNSKALAENRSLRKVDFIWVNRDQQNFEWFMNLLRQFEQEQEAYLASNADEKRFLDIHLFFTEIKHDKNIGNVPLDLVRKIWAEVAGHDIFTNLKSKTHIGRPNWERLFTKLISGENTSTANDVNVFFCGPTTMAKSIQNHCEKFRFRFYEEKF